MTTTEHATILRATLDALAGAVDTADETARAAGPTPLRDSLAAALTAAGTIDARQGATFTADPRGIGGQTRRGNNGPVLTLHAYGTATFRDRTATGARIEIIRYPMTVPHAYCQANTYTDGRGFVDLPEGARHRIAAAVLDLVRTHVLDFDAVADETTNAEAWAGVAGHIHSARRHLDQAIDALDALPAVTP